MSRCSFGPDFTSANLVRWTVSRQQDDYRGEIVRKAILHLGVYPPHGHVRVAAPLAVNDDAVRLAIVSQLAWIRRQQARYTAQARKASREMVSGESHYYLGRRYRLRIIPTDGRSAVVLRRSIMELLAPLNADAVARERVLRRWYRARLREHAVPLFEKWQEILGVRPSRWRIQQMKTKWGSCSSRTHGILVNLELVKKPLACIEYVVAHELAHLHERTHNERFVALLDRHLPDWRRRRDELNSLPIAS